MGRSFGVYLPDAPSPEAAGPLCTAFSPPVISRGAPRQATWETSISEGRNWARNGRSILPAVPTSQGSFYMPQICDMGQTALLPLRSHAVDFFAWKIRRLFPGSNPRSWVPEASMLTTRPPKPLKNTQKYRLSSFQHRMYLLIAEARVRYKHRVQRIESIDS
jgi:hypothetical protein